jgi:hypothetical protein
MLVSIEIKRISSRTQRKITIKVEELLCVIIQYSATVLFVD